MEILRLMVAVVAVVFASAFASVVLTALLWLCQRTYEALGSLADNRTRKKRKRDENAKLRELLAIASDMARDYDGDRRLLRQLMQELYEDQCSECDQWKYRDRMHELGVEVDG